MATSLAKGNTPTSVASMATKRAASLFFLGLSAYINLQRLHIVAADAENIPSNKTIVKAFATKGSIL